MLAFLRQFKSLLIRSSISARFANCNRATYAFKEACSFVYVKRDLDELKGAERMVLCGILEVSCHWMVISSICQSFMRLISENGQSQTGTDAVGCMG